MRTEAIKKVSGNKWANHLEINYLKLMAIPIDPRTINNNNRNESTNARHLRDNAKSIFASPLCFRKTECSDSSNGKVTVSHVRIGDSCASNGLAEYASVIVSDFNFLIDDPTIFDPFCRCELCSTLECLHAKEIRLICARARVSCQ